MAEHTRRGFLGAISAVVTVGAVGTPIVHPSPDPDVINISIGVTQWELATYTTPELLREVVDAKITNVRNLMIRTLREQCGRVVDPKPSIWA